MPTGLDNLLPHLPAWLLVLFRITGIFVLAPLLGSSLIPARIKILWALGLSFVVYPMLLNPASPSATLIAPVLDSGLSLWRIIPAVALELLIGVVIGYGASLPLMGLQVAGRICDQQMGLGLAGIFNPELGEQSGPIEQFYFLLALAIFLILGGHRIMLFTLLGTFDHIPPGGFRPDGRLLDLAIGLLGSVFDLGLRIAAPLLCLVFLETVALGFIARTVPQMNILSIGFPLRILLGFMVLVASIRGEMQVFIDATHHALRMVRLFFGAT